MSETEYLTWLTTLKAGDTYDWLDYPAYGDAPPSIRTRVVQKRTRTQLVFADGLRVHADTGRVLGHPFRRLEASASLDEIQSAKRVRERRVVLHSVQDKLSSRDITRHLSIEALLQIERILNSSHDDEKSDE